jgi:hypothetical protein
MCFYVEVQIFRWNKTNQNIVQNQANFLVVEDIKT